MIGIIKNGDDKLKSKLANHVDNCGKIYIRIRIDNSSSLGYDINFTLKFSSDSYDSLRIIKEELGKAGEYNEIKTKVTTTTKFELSICSSYVIKQILNPLLPLIVKNQENVFKALEIITLLEKFKKSDPKNLNLFLQVCALVDQYRKSSNRPRCHHTEKTVRQHLKFKEICEIKVV
jgi:hypothetical protein